MLRVPSHHRQPPVMKHVANVDRYDKYAISKLRLQVSRNNGVSWSRIER